MLSILLAISVIASIASIASKVSKAWIRSIVLTAIEAITDNY